MTRTTTTTIGRITPIEAPPAIEASPPRVAYAQYPLKGLVDLHATPAKDTDFKGFIESYRQDTGLSIDDNLLLGALCDAERLAGV